MNLDYLAKFSSVFGTFMEAGSLLAQVKDLLAGKGGEAQSTINDDRATDGDDEIDHSHINEMKSSAAHMMVDAKDVINEITELFGLKKDEVEDEKDSDAKTELLKLAKSE